MRSWVKLPRMPSGIWPDRATPGKRRAVTRFASHWTPAHEQGLWRLAFQSKVRPPTADLSARSAARSDARSGSATGTRMAEAAKKLSKARIRSCIMGDCSSELVGDQETQLQMMGLLDFPLCR